MTFFFRSKQLALWLALLFISGCATVKYDLSRTELDSRVKELQAMILQTGANVSSKEALSVAKVSIYYPLKLAKEYELTSSPVIHNILVNQGIKPRGLCTHWTEDMLRKLATLNLETLKFYWIVANREEAFRLEHSALAVAASDKTYSDGVVLDAWRDSGILYFSRVVDDKYQWLPHYNDITAELIIQRAAQ